MFNPLLIRFGADRNDTHCGGRNFDNKRMRRVKARQEALSDAHRIPASEALEIGTHDLGAELGNPRSVRGKALAQRPDWKHVVIEAETARDDEIENPERTRTERTPSHGRRNRASLTRMAQSASHARAWIGTIVFLFLAPGVVAGLIPWLISGWRWYDWGGAAWVVVPIAWISIAIGVAFLLHAFALFALHRGTPAPVAPTQTLVVTGVYRFVRNPMYLAVLTIILGQALLFGSWWLVLYAVMVLAAVVAFVKGYEEPTLTGTYGGRYLDYRRNVPGWWPRLTPWRE